MNYHSRWLVWTTVARVIRQQGPYGLVDGFMAAYQFRLDIRFLSRAAIGPFVCSCLPYRLSSWALDDPANNALCEDEHGELLAWAVLQAAFCIGGLHADKVARPQAKLSPWAVMLTSADMLSAVSPCVRISSVFTSLAPGRFSSKPTAIAILLSIYKRQLVFAWCGMYWYTPGIIMTGQADFVDSPA